MELEVPRMVRLAWLARTAVASAAAAAALTAAAAARAAEPAEVYEKRCAVCHDHAAERTPSRDELRGMAPEEIVTALTRGAMRQQADGLSRDEVRELAAHISSRPFGTSALAEVKPNPCKGTLPPLRLADAQWNGWSRDLENTRYQPKPGLKATEVPRLKLKWARAYPGPTAFGQPSIVGNRLYVTSATGRLSALDPKTGCEYWTQDVGSGMRSVVVGELPKGSKVRFAAFFGDTRATAHAIDAETGAPLWNTPLAQHPFARVTGAPVFYQGRLYVPLSSGEEGAGANPKYGCCTFRGSLAALDAQSGAVIWQSQTIREPAHPSKTNSEGTQLYGPAGAAIWSAPTVDPRRGVVYVGTGNSYTDVDTDATDSIVAFELATGERRWIQQFTEHDNFVMRCAPGSAGQGNCPQTRGGDFDFGSSPILRTLAGGKQVLLAGQKSGVVYALDPDDGGKLLWRVQLGSGSVNGGVEFGPAADAETLYVAISDVLAESNPQPGLTALKIATGEKLWQTPTPTVACTWGVRACTRAQPAAVTAMPGVVFSGALDGHIRAYSTADGRIVWDFDTAGPFDTINGVRAEGGSIDGGGTTLGGGMLYVNSGYGIHSKHGRLLLAFSVDGK
jgi:polyvinyl alcohol dehydrogenase (cytochrome)